MDAMPYTDAKGRVYKFGEFFPTELSASPYNITAAYEHFPLTREEVLQEGYAWEGHKEKEYAVTKSWSELPQSIAKVDDGILDDIISCETQDQYQDQNILKERNCAKAFRIVPEELSFYKKMGIPLPTKCFNCRHFDRLKRRNPLKLWRRQCMCDYKVHHNGAAHVHHSEGRCPNQFETSYSPERKEIIYCTACYNAEVV
jgi:hypothetical protein